MHGLSSRYYPVYFFAIVSSLAISIWSGLSAPILNTDGVCYLLSAESLSHGLRAAMQACTQAKWPFYSILIAGLVHLTKISYVHAAYFLNGMLSILSAVMFVNIVLFIGQSSAENNNEKRTTSLLWFAALVIFLANEFNSVKYYVIRDHGFWAFYLLSIFLLLKFFNNQRWLYALGWGLSLIVATLFRIEGAVFIIMLPFLAFLNVKQSFRERVSAFFKLDALFITLGLCLVCWVVVATPSNLGRLSELPLQLTQGFSRLIFDFNMRADQLSQYVLSHYSARYSAWILFITLAVWYVISVAKNVSFIYSFLVVYAWSKKLLKASFPARLVIWGYLIVNLLVTALFLAEHMFLSKRYLIAMSLVLMLWIPFALEHLYLKWSYKKWPIVLALALIVFTSLGGIFQFGHSKKYIEDAGSWLAKNAPADAAIFSNDILVMYYSHRFGNELFDYEKQHKNLSVIENGKWKQYNYLALRVNKSDLNKELPLIQEINEQPVQVFTNKRGDQVRIYKSKL